MAFLSLLLPCAWYKLQVPPIPQEWGGRGGCQALPGSGQQVAPQPFSTERQATLFVRFQLRAVGQPQDPDGQGRADQCHTVGWARAAQPSKEGKGDLPRQQIPSRPLGEGGLLSRGGPLLFPLHPTYPGKVPQQLDGVFLQQLVALFFNDGLHGCSPPLLQLPLLQLTLLPKRKDFLPRSTGLEGTSRAI